MSGYRIVVGVDGSDGGRRALRWAIHDATVRHGTIQAVHAWRWDTPDLAPHASTTSDEERQQAEETLSRDVTASGANDSVPIAMEVVEGRAAEVLTAAARDADLLVVGSHGHSQVWHTVLGSVSEECVRRATYPVVVIPVGATPPPGDANVAVAAAHPEP